jgi:hypothetical protein
MFLGWPFGLVLLYSLVHGLPHGLREEYWNVKRRKLAFEIPLRKRGTTSGTVGLGDNSDLLYTVPIELGETTTAVQLDTGSSDLWVISDACTTDICKNATAARYPSATFNPTAISVKMNYGDSKTGTFASGPVGIDAASIAGVTIAQQAFVSVNDTSNKIVQHGAAGILGLGFPSGSVVQANLAGRKLTSDDSISSISTNGPLLSRLAMSGELEDPMFAVTLQRSTVDISGQGQLSIGKLPNGVDNSSLTWVPVRLYKPEEGGLKPPTFAPNEVYPFRWEVDIDGVFLDGQRLADSTIPSQGVSSTTTSALIDTGNSLLRGPSDVVQNILTKVSPSFSPSSGNAAVIACNVPHTLSFQIGGKMFPIDPRDFISPSTVAGDTTNCIADNVVATDSPSVGSLFSWNLGDPFFKSNVVAFHFGNLTHPSVDPPRIGLLSTVPNNADSLLQNAIQDAVQNGGKFESTFELAPTVAAAAHPESTIVISTAPGTRFTASSKSSQASSTATTNRKNAASSITLNYVPVVFAALLPLILSGFHDALLL